jgi:hypothetical protein
MSIKNNRLNNLLNSENNFIYNNQRIFSRDHLSKNLLPTNENRTEHKKFFQNTNNSDIFFQNEIQSKSRNLSSKKYFKSNESDIFFQSPEKTTKNLTIKKAKKNVSNNIFQESNENINNNKNNNKKIDKKNLRLYESDIFFQKEDKNIKKRPIKSGKKNNSKIGKNYEENKKIEGKKILKKSNESDVFFQSPDKNKQKIPINNTYKNKSNVEFTYSPNKSLEIRENSPIQTKIKNIQKRILGKSGSAKNINFSKIKVNRLKKLQSEKNIKINKNNSINYYKTELLNNENKSRNNNNNNSLNKFRSITHNVPNNKSIDWINFRTENYNRQEFNENYNKTKNLSPFNKKINDFIGNFEPEKHVKLQNQKLNKYKFLSNMFNENQDNLNEIRTLFKDYNSPHAHVTKLIENFSNFYGKENFKEKISANSSKNIFENKFEIKNIKPEDFNDIIKEFNKNGINVYDVNYSNNFGCNFHGKENVEFKIKDKNEKIDKMKEIVNKNGKIINKIKKKENFPKKNFVDKNTNIKTISTKKNVIRSGNNHNFSQEFNKIDNRYKNNFGKNNFIKY